MKYSTHLWKMIEPLYCQILELPFNEGAEMRAILIQYGSHLGALFQRENNFESKHSKF